MKRKLLILGAVFFSLILLLQPLANDSNDTLDNHSTSTPEPSPNPSDVVDNPINNSISETENVSLDSKAANLPDPIAISDLPPFPLNSIPGVNGEQVKRLTSTNSTKLAQATIDEIPLLPGWNLISIPQEQVDTDPATVLASIAGSYSRVYAYDNCDTVDPWKIYDPNDLAGSDLTAIDNTMGLWVEMASAASLSISGSVPSSTDIPLCTGWNLIGYPVEQELLVAGALNSIDGRYDRLFGYEVSDIDDYWEVHSVGFPDYANDLQLMKPTRGYWIRATENATLTLAGPPSPLEVEIFTPKEDAEITYLFDVTGVVTNTVTTSWQLDYRLKNEAEWINLSSGDNSVTNATLAEFDPTLLINGMYEIRLFATDTFGQTATDLITVLVDGELKVGPVSLAFVDMAVPVAGVPVNVVRRYDSRDKNVGDFGVGWTLNISQGSYINNRKPGDGWVIVPPIGVPRTPCSVSEETKSHVTEIRLSEEEVYRFKPNLELFGLGSLVIGGCVGTVSFSQISGQPGAELLILDSIDVVWTENTTELLNFFTFEVYEPKRVQLKTPDGRIFDLTLEDGITRVEDRNGTFLAIEKNGITHSTGIGITFVRDELNRITQIVDPLGYTVNYTYDAAGDLIAVTNQIDETTQFVYSTIFPHHLVSIIDNDGVELAALDYDSDGRLVESCNADNSCVTTVHDIEGQIETVFDGSGIATIYTYDDRGNILTETDALGNVTSYAYDGDDNLIQVTNPEGEITSYSYDANGNLLSRTDAHGPNQDPANFTTEYAYNGRNLLTAVELPTGASYSLSYDDAGNQTEIRDGEGNLLFGTVYEPNGLPIQETDPFGTITTSYDSAGNIIESVDAFGNISTMTYDASNQLVGMVDDGTTYSIAYDGLGREYFADYGDGVTVNYGYDGAGQFWTTVESPQIGVMERKTTDVGNFTGWILPNGGEVSNFYDGAGRLTQEIDPIGATTQYFYDDAGRLDRIIQPNGGMPQYSYDSAGRVISETNALGETTLFNYGSDGRIASMTNDLGHTWSYSYTVTSTITTDPLGRQTINIASEYGIPKETINPDGTREVVTYLVSSPVLDGGEYPTSYIDAGGNTRFFDYDNYGRLISSTDLAGVNSTFNYDEYLLTSIVGPTGETRSYTYDPLGNIASISYADGSTAAFEYGANNLPAETTLPSGNSITFEYDQANRLISEQNSLGDVVTFEWNENDSLTEMNDANGTTFYSYDAFGQLESIAFPNGARIEYGYDLLGRIINIRTWDPNGNTYLTTYEYDGAGNVISVVDPLGGTTTMIYDAVNRLIQRELPNGVRTNIAYNLRDQIISINHSDSGGTVLASVAYERTGFGEPAKITREDGSYVLLEYDDALRLTSEEYYDVGGNLLESISYSYDAAGNRQTKVDSTDIYSYVYQPGYQIVGVKDSSSATTEAYTYDTDGRVSSIIRDGTDFELSYSPKGQLTQVINGFGTTVTEYVYDAGGRRVSATDSTGTRDFLVAPTMGSGLESMQMIADGGGNLEAGYVYVGEFPLMRFGPNGPVYYLTDAMGSVVSIADNNGNRAAIFEYDSFGNIRNASGTLASPPIEIGGDFRFHNSWLESSTGFYYMRTRDYDGQTGAFLTRDPLEPNLLEPESLNPYIYAYSNPHVYIDPTGEFTLIGLNVSLGIQDVLQGIRTFSIQQIREYALDKIGELTANLLVSFLDQFGGLRFGKQFLDSSRFGGNLLEFDVSNIVCDLFEDSPDYSANLYFEVSVSRNGKPGNNGLTCNNRSNRPPQITNNSNPDLIISSVEPATLQKEGDNSYLIAEFKYNINSIFFRNRSSTRRQLTAITNHARDYSYKIALYVSWKPATQQTQHRLLRVATGKGIGLFILSVTD